ncbi:McrB family protein [Enterococcus faecium]|uniref:McrB family protein n=1 Tax=Enterococcus faecium TaxID=1352 RepID=UPI0035C8C8D5
MVQQDTSLEEGSLSNFSKWYLKNKEELLKKAELWKKKNKSLANEFLDDWPLERLSTMSLDEYVTGKGSQNKSLCYEIEHGKYAKLYLGIKGGNAGKFGIYWSKKKQAYCDKNKEIILDEDIDEKFTNLKNDLITIIKAGIAQSFDDNAFTHNNSFYSRPAMVMKLLCVYSKETIFSGINMNKDKKEVWEKLVSSEKFGGVYKLNFDITTIISEKHPELDGELLSSILWDYRNTVVVTNNLSSDPKEEAKRMYTYQKHYSNQLLAAKNLILRGAPGTGKTFLANEMAADVVSNGRTTQINELSEDEKSRIGFVQFHPSYDYTDFVEGLRPTTSDDGVVSFTLKDGSFKSFVEKAKKTKKVNGQDNFEEAWAKFFDAVTEASIEGEGYNKLKTLTGKPVRNLLAYERNEIQGVYPAKTNTYLNHDQIYNVYRGLPGTPKGGFDAYRKAIVKHLKEEFGLKNYTASTVDSTNNQNYVFIIDEINRGEISKIFGELFFSIDPGYRGHKEGVYTQYANLHENPEEKFYIPNNVYIIGTMNDIDRSVDTFDFAMRRRFTFLEIKAEDSAQKMLKQEKTKKLMMRLNEAIVAKEKGGLSTDYQIGASYFLGIDNGEETMDQLWDTKLYPLLKDYFRGEHKATEKLEILGKVYSNDGDLDEAETSTR